MTTHNFDLAIVSIDDYKPINLELVCICFSDCTGWRIVNWQEHFAKECDYWFSLDEINEQLP